MAFEIRMESYCASKKAGETSIHQKAHGYTISWRQRLRYAHFDKAMKHWGMDQSLGGSPMALALQNGIAVDLMPKRTVESVHGIA